MRVPRNEIILELKFPTFRPNDLLQFPAIAAPWADPASASGYVLPATGGETCRNYITFRAECGENFEDPNTRA